MTKIDSVNAAMSQAPYFALSPEEIAKLRDKTSQLASRKNAAPTAQTNAA